MEEPEDDKLSQIRKHYGLTQKEMAERLGIKQGYISAIEQKRRSMSSSLRILVMKHFPEIDINWLVFDQGPMINTTGTYVAYPGKTNEAILKTEIVDNKNKPAKNNYLIEQYRERYTFELENNNPEISKLRQEADNFSYRAQAITKFHAQYLGQFSYVLMGWNLQTAFFDKEEISYDDYKEYINKSLEDIGELKKVIEEGNKQIKKLLSFLKEFDNDNIIEDYLIK